jgi:two-component system OmpR family sensor kinase
MLDRLDAALRNQRELLDDVRHELRTPLTVIRGHLELVDAADPADVRTTVELAIDELQRMAGLVDGLATLAEMRATVPVPEVTDLGRLTRDVAALASVIPGHTWSTTEIADGSIPLDRALITQAWLQLADNAAKYAPAGTPIEIGSRIDDDSAELWVRDYGPGIRSGQETRIFERFARSTDGSARGSGLGLAIVEGIALAHGGSARVESPGDGARFVIDIPREGAE